jgi:hypothetical protein
MGVFDEKAKNGVLSMIRSSAGAEVVETTADRIVFCGRVPLRTFQIIGEAPERFRVKETTGFQTAGRRGEPTPYSDRDIITESQMIGWVTERLQELAAA